MVFLVFRLIIIWTSSLSVPIWKKFPSLLSSTKLSFNLEIKHESKFWLNPTIISKFLMMAAKKLEKRGESFTNNNERKKSYLTEPFELSPNRWTFMCIKINLKKNSWQENGSCSSLHVRSHALALLRWSFPISRSRKTIPMNVLHSFFTS